MYLLDTNVLSECMRPRPDPQVLAWLDASPIDAYQMSATTQAEIELGIALLPEGKRKHDLMRYVPTFFKQFFKGACLPLDGTGASLYARIVSQRCQMGRPITIEDGQIAAVALQHDLTLVTRNVKDFVDIPGLRLINPWVDEASN